MLGKAQQFTLSVSDRFVKRSQSHRGSRWCCLGLLGCRSLLGLIRGVAVGVLLRDTASQQNMRNSDSEIQRLIGIERGNATRAAGEASLFIHSKGREEG